MSIELVTTDGIFSLDGEDFDFTNNIWIIGDDREVVVVDAAHDHLSIVEAVGGRRVRRILLTHGHNDHINAAAALADAVDAPIALHPDDRMLWDVVYPDRSPDIDLAEGARIDVGGHDLSVLHTPGHAPGCCCFYDERTAVLFSGDTLFCGGPGATGRSTAARPPYEGSAYVEWLADVLDALGLNCSRFCGLSLGGWAALRFAAGHPQRVVAAAVLAPGGVVPARESFTGSIDKTLASEAGMRRMAEAIFFPQPVPPGVTEAFALMQRIYRARTDDLPVITDSELLSITAPVLLLGGAHDALLDVRASETRLSGLLPRLTSEIDEAAGHALIGKAAQVTDFFLHGAGARTDVPVPRTG